MTQSARPDPEPHDGDLDDDLRREVERAAGPDGETPAEQRDEPAFTSDADGMDAPPPG